MAISRASSFCQPHFAFAADGFCITDENAVSRGYIFYFHFISAKIQDFLFLSFCKSGFYPHFTSAAEKSCVLSADSVFCGNVLQLHLVSAKFQYLVDLFQSKFGVRVFSFVLGRCERLQMIGVDAAAYAAEMVELQSFWDRANDQVVEVSMSAPTTPKNFFVFGSVSQMCVSTRTAKTSNPNPTQRAVASIFQHKSVGKFLIVSADVIFWLAFFISRSFFSLLRNRCFLAASTFAKPVIRTLQGHSTTIAWSVI